jgi:hypothetical protein
MQDLSVDTLKVTAIYAGVRSPFGTSAWNEDKTLKSKGEKRILKTFPPNAGVTWAAWKKMDVF